MVSAFNVFLDISFRMESAWKIVRMGILKMKQFFQMLAVSVLLHALNANYLQQNVSIVLPIIIYWINNAMRIVQTNTLKIIQLP